MGSAQYLEYLRHASGLSSRPPGPGEAWLWRLETWGTPWRPGSLGSAVAAETHGESEGGGWMGSSPGYSR